MVRDMARGTATALVLVAALTLLAACQSTSTKVDPESLRGGETRATMSPLYFNGPTADAYSAARKIPEVLDSLYCYCDCAKHSGHKSLLSCYVDTHAAYCDVCIDEALMAKALHDRGAKVTVIRKAVDERFSGMQH